MKMFSDTMSGARDERPGLAALMEYVREGDTVVAWKLDRLGRNTLHIPDTVKALTDRGVTPHQPHDGHSTCSSSHCDRAPSSSVSPTPSPAGVSDGSRSPEVRVVRGGSLEFSSLRTPLVRLRVKQIVLPFGQRGTAAPSVKRQPSRTRMRARNADAIREP